MKKRMFFKTGLMAILAVVIMAVNTQDVKCDESGGTFYSSSEQDQFIKDIEAEMNAAGYTKRKHNGESQPQAQQGASNPAQEATDQPQKAPAKACEHLYVDKIIKEATCAEDGELESTCSKCGDSFKTTIAATGKHTYTSEVTREATCIEVGETTYTCSVCGDSYTEEIPLIDHKYESSVTKEATCTEDGERTYTCSMCGDSYTEVIPATGHSPNEPVVTKPAGWFTSGEESVICSSCGEVLETTVIPSKIPRQVLIIVAVCAAALMAAAEALALFNNYSQRNNV